MMEVGDCVLFLVHCFLAVMEKAYRLTGVCLIVYFF